LFILLSACARHADEPLVLVSDLDPTIVIDLKYATEDNFVGEVLYDTSLCYLRKSVAERLVRVQKRLRKNGLGLKIWDAYRPLSVQWKMWELVPDPRYVADPRIGSRHNRGAAVDVTLVDAQGRELVMPTGFDDFSEKAHRNYMDLPDSVLQRRALLEAAMTAEGFLPLPTEWWHFDAPGWEKYPVLDVDLKEVVRQ
jgi:D-alanyl-D-alanine dipeptidase